MRLLPRWLSGMRPPYIMVWGHHTLWYEATYISVWGFPRWLSSKESACQKRRCRRHWFDLWVGKIPWRRKWQPTPIFLPGKYHGQRSLAGYSPWGCKELDTTKWLGTWGCRPYYIDGLKRISSINLIICIIQRLPRTFFITLFNELFIRYCRRKTSLDLGQRNGSSCPEFWKPEANIDLLFRISGTVQKCILTFIQKYLLSTYYVPDSPLGSRNTVMSKTGDISAFTDLKPSGMEEMVNRQL